MKPSLWMKVILCMVFATLLTSDACAAQGSAPVVSPKPKLEKSLARNQKLVKGMKAFSQAPSDLQDLVARIVAASDVHQEMQPPMEELASYKRLRASLDGKGLIAIRESLAKVKGTKFKSAIVKILAPFLDEPTLKPELRSRLIAVLKEISLQPYKLRNRHQFVALTVLYEVMPRSEFKAFLREFFITQGKGPQFVAQMTFYQDFLQRMQRDKVKAYPMIQRTPEPAAIQKGN